MKKPMAALVLLLVAGCGGTPAASGPAGRYVSGGTFTVVTSAEPGKFDPATATGSATNAALAYAYDTLTSQRDDGTLTPRIAKSWTIEPSKVTYRIRDDVLCNDGSKLTASQVAQNFSYIMDPKNESPLREILAPVGLSATADDAAGTVTLTTPKPYSFLAESAAQVYLVCGAGLKDRSLLEKGMVGTGLYRLTEFVPGDHRTYTIRPEYAWGPDGVTAKTEGLPQTITIKQVTSESTQVNLMISGQANSLAVTGPDRARLERTPGVELQKVTTGPGQVFLNHAEGRPGADPAVRKALVQATDPVELAKVASGGSGVLQRQLVTIVPRTCTYDAVTGNRPAFDPAAAAAGLEAAGWKPGPDGVRVKDGKPLALSFVYEASDAGGTAIAEYASAQWKQLGVRTELKGVLDSEIDRLVFSAGDWDATWMPISVSFPSELVPFLSGKSVPKGVNFASIANAEYERLAARAVETPGEAGCELWRQAEAELFKNADLLPIVERTALIATRGASIRFAGGALVPSSIRLLKG
ncbi:ABC transporter substrate-binding protein [Nonomuraea sp. NPDC050310]|uniref:ABC transporter substrate-binding protein n=1 Tax=Nonomuraea sp. NPDC050310 TaxID=3154935 RepID=UPI0033FA6CDE